MKEDVEIPDRIPKKRRQLERALDVWIAVWLTRDDLTPSERRRLEEEKQRRKDANPEVVVGFTGTRHGLAPAQRRRLKEILSEIGPIRVHHGDCVGGDETFHSACRGLKVPIEIHPPTRNQFRAWCIGADVVHPAKEFLDRNKDIVQAVTVLLACPKQMREPENLQGQGTWATVRYARKRGVPVKVILPSGELQEGESHG